MVNDPTGEEGLLGNRWVGLGLVAFELFLGMWLLAGVHQRQARIVALVSFCGFLAVSILQGLSGATSCGCFGTITVSPWLMAAIDVVAVISLWFWRPDSSATLRSKPLGSLGFVATWLVLLCLVAFGVVGSPSAGLSEDGRIIGEGRVLVLEPEKWVGKQLPLLRHTDVGSQIAVDQWTVVLHRRDCPDCQKVLAKYERHDPRRAWLSGGPRIAFVEVPRPGEVSPAESGEGGSFHLRGRLTSELDWFVKVPVILQLQDGVVEMVSKSE